MSHAITAALRFQGRRSRLLIPLASLSINVHGWMDELFQFFEQERDGGIHRLRALLIIVALLPINVWQLGQLGEVIRVGVTVLAHRVPNVERKNGGDQFLGLSLAMAQGKQSLVMLSNLRRFWTIQLVLNCAEHQLLASLRVL